MAMSPRDVSLSAELETTEAGRRFDRLGGGSFTAGKDKTSVGPRFLRKDSFIPAISASLTRQTVTWACLRSNSRRTRSKNDSKARVDKRTARWRFKIIPTWHLDPRIAPRPVQIHEVVRRPTLWRLPERGGHPGHLTRWQ